MYCFLVNYDYLTRRLIPYIWQILTGHQDNAEFALAMSPTEPFVLSGGEESPSSICVCVCVYLQTSSKLYNKSIKLNKNIWT